MHSKTLYFLLALAVTVAVATAFYDDDDDDELEDALFEEFMEKRGRKGRGKGKGKGKGKGRGKGKGKANNGWQACPELPQCQCFLIDGEVETFGTCSQRVETGF